MALFGGERDISLFRHVNRELLGDIITQQCAVYKFKIEDNVMLISLALIVILSEFIRI